MKARAVLLAGGNSLRMGRDKCMLDWEGAPLWRHQVETLRASGCAPIAVAAPLRPAWLPESVLWLPDAVEDAGPLGGLLAALEFSQEGIVVALAVDMPLMSAGYLRDLLGRAAPGVGVVPLGARGHEPLAAVYPAAAARPAREWIASGRRDMQGWIESLLREGLAISHPVDDEDVFCNWNTPEDLLGN